MHLALPLLPNPGDPGLTLTGRMRGQHFLCVSGAARPLRNADPALAPEENRRQRRDSAGHDA